MKSTILFATDLKTEEIIISESQKGSNTIDLIERIHRNDNEVLYDAVLMLSKLTNMPNFDTTIYKAMDKVCQLIYNKHIG